jgi:hypothetical protein
MLAIISTFAVDRRLFQGQLAFSVVYTAVGVKSPEDGDSGSVDLEEIKVVGLDEEYARLFYTFHRIVPIASKVNYCTLTQTFTA